MEIQEWQIQVYQSAAFEMCYKLQEDPYSLGGPNSKPRWFLYAERIVELKLMLDVLRQFGHVV